MSKTIEDLRAVIFDALQGVKDGSLSVEKAKMISELSQVMVNSAKVEVQFIEATNSDESAFLMPKSAQEATGITGVHVHKIR